MYPTKRKIVLLVLVVVIVALLMMVFPGGSVYSEIPTQTPSFTSTPSPTLEKLPSPTSTFTPVPTFTFTPTATSLPTNVTCQVPVSVMLHWYDADILEGLLNDISTSGYVVTTYKDALRYCQQGYDISNAVVITFDDVGPSSIYPALKWMLEYTNSRGFVGVVGVVGGDLSSEDWKFLAELSSYGWEIANHSRTHPKEGLPFLSDTLLRDEISYVQIRVQEELGVSPISLILPGGTYNRDVRLHKLSEEFGIKFIVGIGTPMDPWFSGEAPYYVGRVAPWKDGGMTTWQYALRVFGPQ